MKEFISIGLVVFILGVSVFSLYRFTLERSGSDLSDDLPPMSNTLMVWLALVVAAIVLLCFVTLNGKKLNIENNIGQVGDFVGGLINPVLSFLALLVLLRTTLIQTVEARKTTSFMASQQKILEAEKFETTYFQLVDRVEKYCELYLRGESKEAKDNRSVVSEAVRRILSRRSEFDLLSVRAQLKAVKLHVCELVENDDFNIFLLRAVRVINMVGNATLPENEKLHYMEMFRDTVLPQERIIFCCYMFFKSKAVRQLIRKYNFCFLMDHAYPSKVIADYYKKVLA